MNRNGKCEVKQGGRWRLMNVREALKLDREEAKRCPTCYGHVRLHRRGGATPAHFEHRTKNVGCPQCYRYDGRGIRLHIHRVD
jgi:uncharacterized protein with PIN domain